VLPAAFCLVNTIMLKFFLVYELDAQERETAIAAITRALEQGELQNRIGPIFPLSHITSAHEAVEAATLGNVIVTM
jgi:NADPH2:quinone reductase